MDLDLRILVVLLPVILAAGWAVSRILPYALQQVKGFLAK
jgi:photosystem II PsbY protein